jgi:hypothetical protein
MKNPDAPPAGAKKGGRMPFLREMHHYVSLTLDRLYHVQNMAGAMIGQHHVHSHDGFRKWKKKINKKYLHMEKAEFCACGLEPGYVKEYDGRIWFNEDFE